MPRQQVGLQPVVVNTPDVPGTVYNASTTVSVFWGNSASQAQQANASVLQPQTAIQVDGTMEIYAAVTSGNTPAPIDFFPGAQNFTPGQINITSGSVTISGPVTVSGTVAVSSGTISISGVVTVTGAVTISSGTISITGTVTVTGAVSISSGTVNISAGNVTVSGNVGLVQAPTFITSGTVNGTNTAWGPLNASMPNSAQGYQIVLLANSQASANFMMTDILIKHLDVSNNVVFSESFSVTNYGNTTAVNYGNIVIRGQLHGTSLAIYGYAANSTILNNIVGGAGLTYTGFTITVYAMPNLAPKPLKLSIATTGNSSNVSPNTQLFFSLSTPVSGTTFFGVLEPYCGDAIVSMVNQTAASNNLSILQATNVQSSISGRTVQWSCWGPTLSGINGVSYLVKLPGLITWIETSNTNATAGSATLSVTGGDYT